VILAVCSAFAYLLSALLSSVVWLVTSAIGNAIHSNNGDDNDGDDGDGNSNNAIGTLFALAIPGVLCQMIVRCLFVNGYFKVENVIRRSVAKHEKEEIAAHNANNNNAANNNSNNNNNNNNAGNPPSETNALQLQLNDLSCSIAAGCGYALLHALFLYGTLLASESGESGSYDEGAYGGGGGSTGYGGTLYQASCGGIPSLINGALISCMFSVLDVMWMMLCFFGMRRRSSSSPSSQPNNNACASAIPSSSAGPSTIASLLRGITFRGLTDTPSGGNAAVLLVGITHLAASLVLAPNGYEDGCKISLPLLGGVVLWVAAVLRRVVAKGRFLPEDQRRRIQGMQLGLGSAGQTHHVE